MYFSLSYAFMKFLLNSKGFKHHRLQDNYGLYLARKVLKEMQEKKITVSPIGTTGEAVYPAPLCEAGYFPPHWETW